MLMFHLLNKRISIKFSIGSLHGIIFILVRINFTRTTAFETYLKQ